MTTRTLRLLGALLVALCLGACASGAKLKAADKYAEGLKGSVAGLQALVDDQAAAARMAEVALTVSPVTSPTSTQTVAFQKLACAAYSEKLAATTLMLAELSSYQAYVEAAAGDPEDSSLSGMLGNIQAVGKLTYERPNEVDVKDELAKRKAACDAEVAALLGAPGKQVRSLGGVLSVWPSIKSLLEFGANAIDRQRRLAALKRLAEDPAAAKRFQDAILAIQNSGELQDAIQFRRKEALWLAFSHYKRAQESQSADAFVARHKHAVKMNAALDAYQRYADIDLAAMLAKIRKANDSFTNGMLKKDATIDDLFAVLDFLSGLSEKVADAKKKIEEAGDRT